ncbi:MAG TPA: glycosyl hydrolase [Thermoanaerobaculia bacterium]|nr:glycosyl hydrolase [Thermoanaerobaculia bacterium]
MNARKRYQFAFFATGWLITVGILFQMGMGAGFRSVFGSMSDRLSRLGQIFSDAEGRAVTGARGASRSDYLEPLRPVLSSADALRRPSKMLLGLYDGGFPDSFKGFEQFESQLRYKFPIISFYGAWGDKPNQQFPLRMMKTIDRMGSVPMITWEPWVTDFDSTRRTNLPPVAEREYASLAAIAKGSYDFYIVPWATEAARFKKPILLRFAHEMNDPYRYPWGPQNGNRPEDFINAWKHVHSVFQKMGANNVLWVWSPHISMPWFEYYYPGADQVDWVGIGILNYGDVASWSRWWTFHQIIEKSYGKLTTFDKPIIVSELGTLSSGGDAVEWYRQAFYHLEHTYPKIRSLVFFNQTSDTTMSTAPLNWSMLQSPRVSALVSEEIVRQSSK